MFDLSTNEIKKIISEILLQYGYKKIKELFMIVDKNDINFLIFFDVPSGYESISFRSSELDDFKNKLIKKLKEIV